MSKKRLTEDEYTEMALDFEREDIRPVGEPVYGDTILRRGRPSGQHTKGSTPVRSFRLPEPLIERLDQRAAAEHVTTSELTRRALTEYLARP